MNATDRKLKPHIRCLAVYGGMHRRGIGRSMLEHMKEKLMQGGRNRLVGYVRCHNLDSHLFLKACGFRAVGMFYEHFENGEDAYLFRYRYREAGPV